ncbi:UDP-N-acetylmuramyl pentapeptide synthase [Methanococcoides vulcani]|uniref:UDP-N-acetylmuramyl pentapeptide synthase n=1 Tax=Methanococcoides vulcani TaxID=1353158 RepID=A0A1H9YKM6_9EURY|nr:coenzyme F430 synthase [Methanococcoides vulcani]SES69604.1 UDP-N-acetylmuramyl pentapeptide synthase [Methanococcoides vulcani]
MTAGQRDAIVLDLTHAGIPIAKEMVRLGYNVRAIDVYDTLDKNTIYGLQQIFPVLSSNEIFELKPAEIIVSPVHLNPEYHVLKSAKEKGNTVITHHTMVGKLILESGRLSGSKVIELTGTKAKTSTASILADILSRSMDVVLHTSRGLEHWKDGVATIIHKGLSIAPGSILSAIGKIEEENIRPDVFIFETSIGGTGCADIGVITSLEQDYGIANNTALASDAKLQMLDNAKDGSLAVINLSAEKALQRAAEKNLKMTTFSDGNQSSDANKSTADVNLERYGDRIVISTIDRTMEAIMEDGFDLSAYRTAFSAATAISLAMGIEEEHIIDTFRNFRGLTGRMVRGELEGRILIDNSNSGMDIRSVKRALDYASGMTSDTNDGKLVMVLGEEAEQVCEGLPPEDVSDFLLKNGRSLDRVALVGSRMRDIKYDDAYYAGSFEDGLSAALQYTSIGDIIILCVKCFR